MAASAYKRFDGKKIGELNQEHYVYTTNTLASVLVSDFFVTDAGKFHVGDWVYVVVVDDLTKVNLATWAATGAAVYVCVTGSATHVDMAILYTSAFTKAS